MQMTCRVWCVCMFVCSHFTHLMFEGLPVVFKVVSDCMREPGPEAARSSVAVIPSVRACVRARFMVLCVYVCLGGGGGGGGHGGVGGGVGGG